MMQPVGTRFAGSFGKLNTYSINFNAAPRENGISSEKLEQLAGQVRKQFEGVRVECNPYNSPTKLQVSGDSGKAVQAADAFVKAQLEENHVRFDYQA